MSNTTPLKIGIAPAVLVLGGVGIYLDLQRTHALNERDQLNVQVAQESMPELPVSVSFHHALLGHSMVADFHSHAPSDIAVVVDVMDAATHGHRKFEIGVGPGWAGTHMGPLERERFEPGDLLTLTHDGFKPVMAQVN